MTTIDRVWRAGLLTVIAIGVLLAITTAPSSGGPLGQTGYGNLTATSAVFEVGQAAAEGGGDDGINGVLVAAVGGLVVLGAFFIWLLMRRRREGFET